MNEEIQIPDFASIPNIESLLEICHQKIQSRALKQVVWTCKMRDLPEKLSKPFIVQQGEKSVKA